MSEECLRINQAFRDPEGTANAMWTLATILHAQGHTLRAQALCEEALALHRSLNHQLGMGLNYALLGDISRTQGDHDQALLLYQQCLGLWRERENSVNCARVLDSIAEILCYHDEAALGAMLMAAAATIRTQAGARLAAHEQAHCDETLHASRFILGEAAFAEAWHKGSTLTPRQAIDLALKPLALATDASMVGQS